MITKKYVSLSKLQTFLENLNNKFALLAHTHKLADLTDYAVDSELSSTSTNPVQNKVLDAEFEAISEALNVYDAALDDKSDIGHIHEISDVTNLQSSLGEINDTVAQKSQVQIITSDASEVLSTLKIHKLTQEQYDQELANGTLDDNALYLTPEEEIDLSGYATTEQLNQKAEMTHNHDDIYYTETEIDAKLSEINASISDLANDATVVATYETKVDASAKLDEAKAYTDTIASGKSDLEHIHDDRYYTESEVDELIAAHNHDSSYDTKGSADTALENAKIYTDNAIAQKSQVQIITWEADD